MIKNTSILFNNSQKKTLALSMEFVIISFQMSSISREMISLS